MEITPLIKHSYAGMIKNFCLTQLKLLSFNFKTYNVYPTCAKVTQFRCSVSYHLVGNLFYSYEEGQEEINYNV